METEIGVSTRSGDRTGVIAPYPPSVVDRFMVRVDRLPGPVWLFYLALLAVLIVIFNGFSWLNGSVQFGGFDLYRTSIPVYLVFSLALMHYLDHVAHLSLAAFRPALGASEAEYLRYEYELTTLPRKKTWWVLGLSLFFTAAYIVFTPNLAGAFRQSPWLVIVDSVFYIIVFGLIAALVYHTLRQIRLVSLIHASAKNVNLFQRTPLYAFSGLTARTGIGILLLNYLSVLTDPTTFVNPALIGLTVFASLAAIACFVFPLIGMHNRIVSEKKHLIAEANTRLEATIEQVYRRADTHDLSGSYQLNQLLASLITTREVLEKIPTWPWETGTLTVFVTAFLLPLIVRLFVALLELFVF